MKNQNFGSTVYRFVCSLCRDYERRARQMERNECDINTLITYRHLNETIDRSIAEVCEETIREEMRRDIGNYIGVSRTKLLDRMGDNTFKIRKRMSIEAIARNLHLI